jgi:hypothetical protein
MVPKFRFIISLNALVLVRHVRDIFTVPKRTVLLFCKVLVLIPAVYLPGSSTTVCKNLFSTFSKIFLSFKLNEANQSLFELEKVKNSENKNPIHNKGNPPLVRLEILPRLGGTVTVDRP